jgi:sphingomyelin phosphodiesterase
MSNTLTHHISQAEDRDVCAGVIASEVPALHYALKNMHVGSHTAKTLCSALVGLCDFPDVRPFDLAFPSPKPAKSRPPPSGKPPIKVVHFSDTHVDLSYETGSNYDCSKPICCRVYSDEDAPGKTDKPCGPFGNTKCDPPEQLQDSMMTAIADLNPAFSIYTGDVVAHDVWLVNKEEVLQDLNSTYGAMENHLGLVYAALGNHDAAPLNLFPSNNIPSKYNPQWAYEALTANWMTLTGIESVQNANDYGSYSAIHPNSKLRIISYSSIFYYKYNFFSYTEPMEYDPNGQLTWLIEELQAAENAGQRVWLISHIPSGNVDHFRDYSHYFDQIIQRYEATIAGLFFGHTHTDEFQIAYSDYKNRNWDTATAMGYVAPSMTPTSGPPSFRVYDIDPETFAVMDFTQYIANISEPSFQTKPTWIPYYSVKKDYGGKLTPPPPSTAELTPAFWHNVTVAMEKDSLVFNEFWARRTRGYSVPACTGDCVKNEICALRGADAQYSCVQRTPGFSFSKRDDGGTVDVDLESSPLLSKRFQPECNHAGMAPLLAEIAHKASLAKMKGE